MAILAIACISGCQNNNVAPAFDCTASNLGFTLVFKNEDCSLSNGIIEVIVTGGQPPYSYMMDGGTSQELPKFENLSAGEYIIKVTDSHGCSAEEMALVERKNNLSVSVTTSNSDCGNTNGSINVNASNGVEPYLYQIDNETPQVSPDFVVGPGNYSITINDKNGCELVLSQLVKSNTSYAADVQPIIANSCNVLGCHDGSNSSLPNYNNLGEVQAGASMIKSRTQSGNMPKTGSLTQEQIDLIACWVDDGALDN